MALMRSSSPALRHACGAPRNSLAGSTCLSLQTAGESGRAMDSTSEVRDTMPPSSRSASGNQGEAKIIRVVPCPNCGKKLTRLPVGYPMYDVQCTACSFRAQIKTCRARPKAQILGAGWDIVDKVLKAGYLMPPLFVNFEWQTRGRHCQRVFFFPFIPRTHLASRTLPANARRPGYRMFNYVRLLELPHLVVFDR